MPRVGFISWIRGALGLRRSGGGAPIASPLVSGPAPTLAGVRPDGSDVAVSPAAVGNLDLLFLTSDCRECRGSWSSARRPDVVIVTPDPSTDSPRAVDRVAPAGATVVMSSEAWHAYGVTRSPWKVEVRGGRISSAGPDA